jgi:3',5'-cyclic AMP phosphodiesterase CpdA
VYRKIRILFIGVVCLSAVILAACGDSRPQKGDFTALVIADTHVSNDPANDRKIASFLQQINDGEWPEAAMLIVLGDVVSSVYDVFDAQRPRHGTHRLARADSLFRLLKIPYYLVMGNHDYKIEKKRDSDTYFSEEEVLQMEAHWKSVTGFDPYYAVRRGDWKLIVLNSMRGRHLGRHFDSEQMDWLQAELDDGLPAVLFFHHPLQTDNIRVDAEPHDLSRPETEPRFYEILERNRNRIQGIFVGHGHRWMADRLFGSIPAFMAEAFVETDGYAFYRVKFSGSSKTIDVKRVVHQQRGFQR